MFGEFVGNIISQNIGIGITSYINQKVITPYILTPLGMSENRTAQDVSNIMMSSGLAGLSLAGAVFMAPYVGITRSSCYVWYFGTYLLNGLANTFLSSAAFSTILGVTALSNDHIVDPLLHRFDLEGSKVGFIAKAIGKISVTLAVANLADRLLSLKHPATDMDPHIMDPQMDTIGIL